MTDEKPRRRRRRKKRPVKWKGGRSRPQKDYRTQEYVLTIAEAETAIYQAFVMSDYELTDREVRSSIESLIHELREEGFVPAEERDELEIGGEESSEDLIVWLIKHNWDQIFEEQPRHPEEDLIGCLGVTLDSIDTWSTPSPDSRGYLWYNAAFIQNMGVTIEMIAQSEDDAAYLVEEEPETDEDVLREMGEEWLDNPSPARFTAFRHKALEMLDGRQAQEVINVCQYLIGWTNSEAVIRQLSPLLEPAYRQLGVPFRQRRLG